MTQNKRNPASLVVIEEERLGPHAKRVLLSVPKDLRVFEAHFPGDAILPAHVEVREVVRQCRIAWPDLGSWQGSTGIKFKSPIRPGAQLELVLRRDEGTQRVSFTMTHHEGVCAQGSLRFASEDAPA